MLYVAVVSTRRKTNSKKPNADPRVVYVPQPAKKLKPLLSLVEEVCASVDSALLAVGPAQVGYDNFDRAILIRAMNLLKASRMLANQLHWEVAASCARQMFELVINMEALGSMPDREQASFQYALFGLLQQTRAKVLEHDYAAATGRPVDAEHAARMVALLEGPHFDQFKGKPKANGDINWAKSWNKKSAWDMADASSNKIRVAQYRQLFSAWSEETHAAPGALIDSMFRAGKPGWADEVLNNDLKETAQILSIELMLFFELWMLLVNVPAPVESTFNSWCEKLNAFMHSVGAFPPES